MHHCEICGSKADIHHIVHKHEGGFDIKLNYKYLCNYHHRGKTGPHNDIETDLRYKLELQDKLFSLLPKKYYKSKELYLILEISNSTLKKLIRNLKVYKEGYSTEDVIKTLMGGNLYSYSMITEIELEHLFNSINIS